MLNILKYPDPLLKKRGERVTEFDDWLKGFVADMFETMSSASGIGLAAPQVGVQKRIFVMDCSGGQDKEQRIAMINPEVIETEGEQEAEEGCLSFPGIYFPVKRAARAKVRAQDVNGKEFEIDGTDLIARCMLHETDHCNGVLYIDRTTRLKKEMVMRKIKKMIQAGEW